MFQRRHYKVLAKILSKSQTITEMTGGCHDTLVSMFIRELRKDNPRFDASKFEKECYRTEE